MSRIRLAWVSRVASGAAVSRIFGKEPPAPLAARPPRIEREGALVALRLAIGKEGLGLELARPTTIECLDVPELTVKIPHVRFPFDVSGGVAKFRHKRGEIERVRVEVDSRRASRWVEPRVRGLLGAAPGSVAIALRAFGATITLGGETSALAFELSLVPRNEDAVLVVHGARGVALTAPATLLALRATSAILGEHAKREGSRFHVKRMAETLARAVYPEAGARAPSGDAMRVSASGESDGILVIAFVRNASPCAIPEDATLGHEAAELLTHADDALFAGDFDRARIAILEVLERAPRHAEATRRLAEIDAHVKGRAETAIAALREGAMPRCGTLLGELLLETGNVASAMAALLREAERETSSLVSALTFARAAAIAPDPNDALGWLDAAVVRAPRVAHLRWERARKRLAAGRLPDARADIQEIEVLAAGARERHEVLRRAGDAYREAGLGAEASILYERALLYRPEDPEAIAGLGAAIAREGRAARGAALLAQAIAAAPAAWMELELAKVLGDRLGDKPAAIARLRSIADDAAEAIAARGLEGRYRADLGDAAGASLAYARMRERAGSERAAIAWLLEAAAFEEKRGDLLAAQEHLSVARRIDPAVEPRFRELSSRMAPVREPAPEPVRMDEAEAEARIESLTRQLQGDPTNDRVVDELTELLTRASRSMELLALLSARLEDAPPERRAALLPKHREVLSRLEQSAIAEGRPGEAELFRMVRDSS